MPFRCSSLTFQTEQRSSLRNGKIFVGSLKCRAGGPEPGDRWSDVMLRVFTGWSFCNDAWWDFVLLSAEESLQRRCHFMEYRWWGRVCLQNRGTVFYHFNVGQYPAPSHSGGNWPDQNGEVQSGLCKKNFPWPWAGKTVLRWKCSSRNKKLRLISNIFDARVVPRTGSGKHLRACFCRNGDWEYASAAVVCFSGKFFHVCQKKNFQIAFMSVRKKFRRYWQKW